MTVRNSLTILILVLAACTNEQAVDNAATDGGINYDIVLANGRVIDPASGLDAIRDVAITGGKIAAVSKGNLSGATVVDVSGMVVAPGFINIHSHSFTPLGQEFELRDGVTTAIEAESGAFPVGAFGIHEPIAIADRALINFGATVGHAWIRSHLLDGEHADTGFDQSIARSLSGKSPTG